jgi:thiamine-phosphate pyrophosphorylase
VGLILITHPQSIVNESEIIGQCFAQGLEVLHLRKQDWATKDTEDFFKSLKPENVRKIVLHQSHELAPKYNVKGLHLKEHMRQSLGDSELQTLRKTLAKKRMTLSTSFHQTTEAEEKGKHFDYAFIGPVFDSISKEGYTPSLDLAAYQNWLPQKTCKMVALGGVNCANMEQLVDIGFDGVAVLGAVWQAENPTFVFGELKDEYARLTLNPKS